MAANTTSVLIYTVVTIAILAWTTLLAVSLHVLTFSFCYYKSADCPAGSLARVMAILVYFAGIAAGSFVVRWVSGLVERRAQKRRDGIT